MKEFKTIGEQVAILESRGMRVGGDAPVVLLRENYYFEFFFGEHSFVH